MRSGQTGQKRVSGGGGGARYERLGSTGSLSTMEPDPPTDPVDTHDDDGTPPRRESKRLRDRAPVVVSLPAHPRDSTPDRRPPPLHFSTKHYPASAHGERRAGHTHFPRLPPDHAPGPLPDGASASFSYRGPPQPPIPGAAPPVPPPPGGTPLVLDRERPPPPPDYEYGTSQQAMLANMLSQRIDQVDQLRTQLAHAEARIASLSARSNPSAALAQAEARAEAAESRLAAIKEAWRGVESYLDMLGRREAEARAAFIRTLNTGEIGVPPSVPVFGAPTSPYLPVRPPVPPNVPARATTFPALPPAPVVGGNPVIWRHESGRRRPAGDDDEPPSKRQRPDRRREREVRKEKARFSDSPSPPPKDKDTDLSPPIAAIADDKDADADADGDEEVDQIVDDVEMTPAKPDSRPRRSSDPAVPTRDARAGSAGARSDGAVRDLKDKDKDAKEKDPKDKDVKDKDGKEKDPKTNGAEDDAMDAEGSPETDTDELSVDEELLKLSSKSRRKPREREREREYEYDREYARTDFSRPSGYAHDYARYGDPRYGPQGGWYGEYWPEDYRDNGLSARGYQPPPVAPPRAEFAQRNGSGSGTSAPWYAHLKPNSAVQTNTQGQRTCRQCGLAGRYKDGKCVEKWGPGPEGPGTVCDRCRKKMKRVERRGTADASVLASGLGGMPLHHQQQGSFHSVTQPSTQTQTQTPSTQPQTQSTQMSQTQLGTQYSPQRNWNANGNGRYENGRYDGPGAGAGAGGEKRYDLLPSHYAAASSSPAEDERRKGRRREREASPEGAPAAPVKGETAVEAQ